MPTTKKQVPRYIYDSVSSVSREFLYGLKIATSIVKILEGIPYNCVRNVDEGVDKVSVRKYYIIIGFRASSTQCNVYNKLYKNQCTDLINSESLATTS